MDLTKIFTLTREQLIGLNPKDVRFYIDGGGIVYIAKTLGAYWQYDYEAARQGRVGYHAELKSLNHSDGFFVSKILLQQPNILEIMAFQLYYLYNYNGYPRPERVAGIPDGATSLGKRVAEMMDVNLAEMRKEYGRIKMITSIPLSDRLLLTEDFCTKGTGFKEAAIEIKTQQPHVQLLPYELVILNRGGLSEIAVNNVGTFQIVSAAYYPVADWSPDECPLCKMGSKPIKPKATDENWEIITTSQLS